MTMTTTFDDDGYAMRLITCDACGKRLNGTHDFYTIAGFDGKPRDYCNAH